ncbi:MAG: tRNA-modifying protein YgfZ [Caulobacteraceae bacterium]
MEADYDLLNAIDFHKGCYIGQETTSRMKRRSAVKTRMRRLPSMAPPRPLVRPWRPPRACGQAKCCRAATAAPWPCCGLIARFPDP